LLLCETTESEYWDLRLTGGLTMNQQELFESSYECEETVNAPRFNEETARRARPVIPLSQISQTHHVNSQKKHRRWSTLLLSLFTLLIGIVGGLALSFYNVQQPTAFESTQPSNEDVSVWRSNPITTTVEAAEVTNPVPSAPNIVPVESDSSLNPSLKSSSIQHLQNKEQVAQHSKTSNTVKSTEQLPRASSKPQSKDREQVRTSQTENRSNPESERPRRVRTGSRDELSTKVNRATQDLRRVSDGLRDLFEGN
jgi:hypothetical protein